MTPDVFTLRIELGNAAMQTPAEVALALDMIADTLRADFIWTSVDGRIRDANGNTVGGWSVA